MLPLLLYEANNTSSAAAKVTDRRYCFVVDPCEQIQSWSKSYICKLEILLRVPYSRSHTTRKLHFILLKRYTVSSNANKSKPSGPLTSNYAFSLQQQVIVNSNSSCYHLVVLLLCHKVRREAHKLVCNPRTHKIPVLPLITGAMSYSFVFNHRIDHATLLFSYYC